MASLTRWPRPVFDPLGGCGTRVWVVNGPSRCRLLAVDESLLADGPCKTRRDTGQDDVTVGEIDNAEAEASEDCQVKRPKDHRDQHTEGEEGE